MQLDLLIERLLKCEYPTETDVRSICSKATEILTREPNVIKLSAPITLVGDIHGQFYDMLELFATGGTPPTTKYCFLGDYVDRGLYSCETLLLLLCYKIKYPDRVFLLRGNHESRQITQAYGFFDETVKKYGSVNVWRYCVEVFDVLPLGAVLDQSIFCIHGGLSPLITRIDDIDKIDRMQEVPHSGSMSDLLWSDPHPHGEEGFQPSMRGAGFLFGEDTVTQFLRANRMSQICRAHQLVKDGYSRIYNNRLVTVWSAPDYCYRNGNLASIMVVDDVKQDPQFLIFRAAPTNKRGPLFRKPPADFFI
ncbi:hypothetical protein PCE1_001361 [Barthelona sp. PCE]